MGRAVNTTKFVRHVGVINGLDKAAISILGLRGISPCEYDPPVCGGEKGVNARGVMQSS